MPFIIPNPVAAAAAVGGDHGPSSNFYNPEANFSITHNGQAIANTSNALIQNNGGPTATDVDTLSMPDGMYKLDITVGYTNGGSYMKMDAGTHIYNVAYGWVNHVRGMATFSNTIRVDKGVNNAILCYSGSAVYFYYCTFTFEWRGDL
ncbi:MAG: hypothetical protein JKY54_06050 [Flavobacteriales bacterium]|nr:hypothetical protein [Flavobacteriales bacterium]